MTSPSRRTRRIALERNLKRLRSSGRVRTLSPASSDGPDPFEAMVPDAEACDEVEALRHEVKNLRRLHEVIHFLGGADDPAALRDELLDLALSLSGLQRGMLALRVPGDDGAVRFKVKTMRGFEENAKGTPEGKVLRNILNRALETKETLLEGDILEDGILGHAAPRNGESLRLGAVACLPLQAGGDLLGALVLDDPERHAPFAPPERALLRSFARHAALALSRVSEVGRLRRQVSRLERHNERLEAQRAEAVRQRDRARAKRQAGGSRPELDLPYTRAKGAFTASYLRRALRRAEGDLQRAAEITGLPVARLAGLLDRMGIAAHRRPTDARRDPPADS